jgi:chromosome partitioning protein
MGDTPAVLPTHQAGLQDVRTEARAQGVDWLFVDTAAGTDSSADLAVEVADVAVIPCRPLITDLRAIPNSVRLCRNHQKTPYVVLSQVPPKGALDEEARKQLGSIGVDTVLPEVLTFYAAFYNSQVDGRAAVEYEPNGKAAEQMQALFLAVQKLAKTNSSQKKPREKKPSVKKAG